MTDRRRRAERLPPDRELAQAVQASKAPAISRAAAVLRVLGESDTPLGVHSIARELGLVPSTCIGSRFPALSSAAGRCIAAFGGYPEAEVEARFREVRWEDPPSFEDWKAQVAEARVQGFAVDEGNFTSGLTVVAAPVWETA